MKSKNIPAIITLSAGAVASIACIVNEYPLVKTLLTVFIILIIFYIIGLIASHFIMKINKAANDAYILAERERMKEEKLTQETQELKEQENAATNSDSGAITNDEIQ